MAKITNDDVKKLAKLSAISLTDEEIDSYKSQIEDILQYVEKLQEIDTSDVKPTSQVTGLTNVMRADDISEDQVAQEELLKNLPDKMNNQIKVPKVL